MDQMTACNLRVVSLSDESTETTTTAQFVETQCGVLRCDI